MVMEVNVGGATVKVVDPLTEPDVAEMLLVPSVREVRYPALVMVATVVVAEAQVALLVKSCVVPSESVPVAVNCWNMPGDMVGVSGATAIDTTIAGVTVRVAEPEILAIVATIDADPVLAAVAVAPLTDATLGFDEDHVTVEVTSRVDPSV
jgi:hypothetical protein